LGRVPFRLRSLFGISLLGCFPIGPSRVAFTTDLFLQSAIEIGMRDVNRAKFKVLQSSQGQDNANGGVANSGSKCLLEVKARTLRIAFGNQPGLVAVQGAISSVATAWLSSAWLS
jgi:hypothetical protein